MTDLEFKGFVRARLESHTKILEEIREEARRERDAVRQEQAAQWQLLRHVEVQSHENATTLRGMKTMWAALVAAAGVLAGWIGLRSS